MKTRKEPGDARTKERERGEKKMGAKEVRTRARWGRVGREDKRGKAKIKAR